MCCGSDTQTTTSTTQIPPELKNYYTWQMGQSQDLYNRALNTYNAQSQYPAYQGPRVAGFNGDQQAAFGMARNASGVGLEQFNAADRALESARQGYGGSFNPTPVQTQTVGGLPQAQANGYTAERVGQDPGYNVSQVGTQGLGYNASQVNTANRGYDVSQVGTQGLGYSADKVNTANRGYDVAQIGTQGLGYSANTIDKNAVNGNKIGDLNQVQAQTWNADTARQYMNPYTETALRSALDESNRQNDIGRLADQGRAAKAGAFGGSRHGIVDAERDRNVINAQDKMIADAQNQAYSQAQSQFNSDQSRATDASKFNTSTDLSRQQSNQNLGIQALLSNQSAQNSAAQYTAGQNLQARSTDMAAQNAMRDAQAGRAMQGDLANQSAANAAAQYTAGQTLQSRTTDAAAQNAMRDAAAGRAMQGDLANQSATNAASQYTAGQNLQARTTDAAALNAQREAQAARNQQGALANQSAANAASQFGAQALNQTNQYNVSNELQRLLANQQAMNNMGQFNQNMNLSAFNANRDQFNTDRNRDLQAAASFGSLGSQRMNSYTNAANMLMNAGNAQQQNVQQNYTTAYNDFMAQQQYPWAQLSNLMGTLKQQPLNMGQTTTSQQPTASTGQQVAGLGIAALGAAGAAGGFGNLFSW